MKTARNRIFKFCFVLFLLLHFSSILLHSSLCGYSSYQQFYGLKSDAPWVAKLQMLAATRLYSVYGNLSGTSTGYGFFAPNVRSNGVLVVESCGKKLTPTFASHEGHLRFDGYVGDLVNDLTLTATPKDSTLHAFKQRYNDLILKNIALNTLKKNNILCDSFSINYCIAAYSTLATTKKTGAALFQLEPIKTLILTKPN
jgi:hypothetical protein